MSLELTSTAFANGASIPKKYTRDGPNVSPPLAWTEPPANTQSVALVCEDPDAPRGTFIHWVLWNVSASARALPEGVPADAKLPDGGRQGKNGFGRIGYGGPSPPPGKPHRYFFKLYALDRLLELPPSTTAKELAVAMQGHVVAEAQLMGTYAR